MLYAFDPVRSALLLLGGDKTRNERWYEKNLPRAPCGIGAFTWCVTGTACPATERISSLKAKMHSTGRFHQGQSDHFEPPGTDSEISQPFTRPSSPNVNRCSRTETAAFDIVIPIM